MEEFKGSQSYVASEELLRAANIAMVLQKPLLIKGEPGTGKTMLAEAISQSLGKKLIIWNIKSTTKAQDGLYVYDVVQRLYDSQFGGQGVDDIEKYVKLDHPQLAIHLPQVRGGILMPHPLRHGVGVRGGRKEVQMGVNNPHSLSPNATAGAACRYPRSSSAGRPGRAPP